MSDPLYMRCRLLQGPNAKARRCECEAFCGLGDGRRRIRPLREWDDPLLDAMEPRLAVYRDSRASAESAAIFKAMMLATSLEVCEALLRGERVPRSRMDPLWLEAFGMTT